MRLTLHFILMLSFLFFLETSKMFEGENVTFHPNITGLQINSYYWTFMQNNQTEKIINVIIGETKKIHRTRFEGRLDTDVKTGSITIFNLAVNDKGTFQGVFSIEGGNISDHIVKLEVKDADEDIKLDFLVGINVTLNSTMQRLEEYHVVSWLFGKLFPEREIANNKKCPNKHGNTFDNVFLNLTNGDLIIPQITKGFRGKYHCKVWKDGIPCHWRKFNIRVFDQVSAPNITKSTAPPTNGVCSVTCSVENGPEVNLTWFRGNISISSSSNQNVSTLTLLLHIRGEDSSTYSCRAQNPVSVQRKTLDSQRLTCHNAGTAKLWVILVITTLVMVVGSGLFICCKIWRRDHVRDPQRSQSNRETSPQNCRSSLRSEEFLLQSCQGPSYETVK
ncbi:T-lymphocyte surface antigen Ly-9-like [Xiphophorus maculatus]|uniref:T-lymphocyte surface antigen Ly-9-like n=1 Tax=Xiphophorus maculatus TaxID=8083 RepID=UPI000293B7AC|nr:T-lymphocyte surface antigen Ly-9-like [Xiphophorus maculatus]